jgi:hypothetical protein
MVVTARDTFTRPTPQVPRTNATIEVVVDHFTYDSAIVELSWERQLDSLESWGRVNRRMSHTATTGNQERIFSDMLSEIRDRNPRVACLISSARARRTSNMVRVGLWTTELLTERDFGAANDLRVQSVAVGRMTDWEVHPSLDFRLRGEVGAGWLYFTETGRFFEHNGGWMSAPIVSAGAGPAAVLYPLSRRHRFVPYVTAGGDALLYYGREYVAGEAAWRPDFSFPTQLGWAANAAIGLAKPYPVEVAARWSRPTLHFIDEGRTPTVAELSVAVGIPTIRR